VVAVLQPNAVPFSDALLRSLKLPPGFEISVFAQGLGNVRWMQVAANGDVYASLRSQGEVLLLRDTDGDGVADVQKTVARIARVHGLLLHAGKLYMVSDRALDVADVQSDGTLSTPRRLLNDLPEGGNHPRRTLGMGPDGWLYLSVGSTCNNCLEANPENATLLRLRPDGTQREIVARGLRNTMGFAWQPVTGQLYGFDHGSDLRGDDQPPEELNAIVQGKHYGWPWCLGARVPDPVQAQNPPGTSKQAFCPSTQAPAATYTAHSAPIGFVFYTGAVSCGYQGDGFVAMRGSWNALPAAYRVLRVRFGADGARHGRLRHRLAAGHPAAHAVRPHRGPRRGAGRLATHRRRPERRDLPRSLHRPLSAHRSPTCQRAKSCASTMLA
jgi:glucose/arabinose dehydrogenase